MKILVIEDDREAASYLHKALGEAGHQVETAHDGEAGLAAAKRAHTRDTKRSEFDVMIVDRMLPKMDGLTMLGQLRQTGDSTPALILSALGQVDDRVTGLRGGGDDYLTKPYAVAELLARAEALGRRADIRDNETIYEVGDLKLDRLSHSAERAGQHITLQPREFRLLEYLMRHQGQVVTRTMLLENVWDYHFDPQTNVHISRLRAKIEKGFEKPLLHTVRGAGYIMRDD